MRNQPFLIHYTKIPYFIPLRGENYIDAKYLSRILSGLEQVVDTKILKFSRDYISKLKKLQCLLNVFIFIVLIPIVSLINGRRIDVTLYGQPKRLLSSSVKDYQSLKGRQFHDISVLISMFFNLHPKVVIQNYNLCAGRKSVNIVRQY